MLNGKNPMILKTNISYLKLYNSGKVRDIYELDGSLLIIATDRISAFDCVLVKKVEVIPVECIIRGYLAGSSWKEYKGT
jgi:phosphoribosylaminoimidazole-succinocarboxamide synthase